MRSEYSWESRIALCYSHSQGCVYAKKKNWEKPKSLVFVSCYNKYALNWMAYKNNIHFSQFWRLGIPKSWCWQIRWLVKAHFLIDSTFLLCPHIVEGAKDRFQASFIRAQICSWGLCPHDLIPSQRPPSPNNIIMEIRISTCKYLGETSRPQHSLSLVNLEALCKQEVKAKIE